jgi:hypothetical protein
MKSLPYISIFMLLLIKIERKRIMKKNIIVLTTLLAISPSFVGTSYANNDPYVKVNIDFTAYPKAEVLLDGTTLEGKKFYVWYNIHDKGHFIPHPQRYTFEIKGTLSGLSEKSPHFCKKQNVKLESGTQYTIKITPQSATDVTKGCEIHFEESAS